MRKVTLAMNYIAILAAIAMWVHASYLAPLKGAMVVTELDRAGVFNEDRLREHDPTLAKNLRGNVAAAVQQAVVDDARLCCFALGVVAITNIILCHLLGSVLRAGSGEKDSS